MNQQDGFYQALIENAMEVIVVIGMDGKLRYISPSGQKLMGYLPGENMGRNAFELIHPDDIVPLQRLFRKLIREPEIVLNTDFQMKHKDGSWRTVEGIGKRHVFAGDKTPAIVVNYRDVTESRKSEREMQRLASIVENSTDAIFLITLTGVILSWNHGGRLVYGYTAEEIGGRSVHMLFAPGRVQEFERILETAKKGNAVNNFETIHRRKDGSEVLVSMTVSPLSEKTGEITRASIIARPVLEREQADAIRKALQLERDELLQRLQLQMERMPIACVLNDKQNRIAYLNPAAEKMFGYSLKEVIGKSPRGIFIPEFKWTLVEGIFEKLAKGDMSFKGIVGEGLRKDGRSLLCEWYNTPLTDAEGRYSGHMVVALDITERKKAEEMTAQYAAVAEYSNDALLGVDLNGNITSWNKGAEKMFGYSAAEVVGKSSTVAIPQERKEDYRYFREVITKGEFVSNYETVRVRKDGQKIDVSFTISAIRNTQGDVIGASAIARDISEKKKAEEITARFAALAEYSEDAIIGADLDGNINSWNKGAEKIFGFSVLEALGKKFTFYMPTEYQGDFPRFLSMIRKGEAISNYETIRLRKDGKRINVSLTISPVRNSRGEIVGASIIARDISEKKKVEEMTARFAAVAMYSNDAIVGMDPEGKITSWNKGAEKILGYPADLAIGINLIQYLPKEKKEPALRLVKRVLRGEMVSDYETVYVRKNGQKSDLIVTGSPIRDAQDNVTGVSFIVRDVSERKKAEMELKKHEEKLRLAQKMDAIGRLAGGVAHDFNNLLSVIRGNAEYLLNSFPPEDKRREEMNEILKAVQRGAEMTKQLLVFGKKQIPNPQPLNLNDLSLEMERMLKRLIDANIDLAVIPAESLDQIEADHGQIQEVILNLVLNACDAMPKGGHIIIETKNDTFSEPQRDSDIVIPPGHYVRLNVTDTGKGMDQEIQKHLFEPYFSTKKGKGKGLGLSTVVSIVKKWKGHIALHSAPGLGCTFSVFFPAVGKKVEPKANPEQTAPMPKGIGTILLAEDEKPLRRIIVRTLENQGYRVLEATNGEKALKKAEKYRKEINLLLTDVIMPRMDGKELADKLRKTRPDIQVVFISGYPREILSKRGVLGKSVQLIKKPFSMEELIRRIQKVLLSKKKR